MTGNIIKLLVGVIPRVCLLVARLGRALLTGVGARRRALRAFQKALREQGLSAEAAASLSDDFPRLELPGIKKLVGWRAGGRAAVHVRAGSKSTTKWKRIGGHC